MTGAVSSVVPRVAPLQLDAHLRHGTQPPRELVHPALAVTGRIRRCRSRVRMDAAIDDIRFGTHRDLRKIRHDLSRATPRSTGARAGDSARLTVCWVGARSRPGGRPSGVVTHGPAPMWARSARIGTPWRSQIRWVRAVVGSRVRPGRGGEIHSSRPSDESPRTTAGVLGRRGYRWSNSPGAVDRQQEVCGRRTTPVFGHLVTFGPVSVASRWPDAFGQWGTRYHG